MDVHQVIKDTLEMAAIVAIIPQKRAEFVAALKKSGIVVTDDLVLVGTVDSNKVAALMNNLNSLPVLKLALRRSIRKNS